MKELSIEEKAKAYDEAIERVKNYYSTTDSSADIKLIGLMFPELREESEDERIRKGIIRNLEYLMDRAEGFVKDELKERIAWLEKQGSQNLANSEKTCKDEQKPVDKVEHKFEIGDWVVYDHRPYQVVELPKEGYINLGLRGNGKIEYVPSTYCRPWTIQDAKEGDVLFYDSTCGFTFIYDGINPKGALLYSYVESNDGSPLLKYNIGKPNVGIGYATDKNIYPATKEQRDLLFQKMQEAGYKWDAEKKELKKIEQKPAGVKRMKQSLIGFLLFVVIS